MRPITSSLPPSRPAARALLAAGLLALAACGGASGGATVAADPDLMSALDSGGARQVEPGGPAAAAYESRPASRQTAPAVDDPLRTQLFYAIVKSAAAGGVTVVADARLDAAMNDLARMLRDDEQPRSAAVEFLLGHYGVVEPYPVQRYLRAPRDAQDQLAAALLSGMSLPPGEKLVTMGIGVDRSTTWLSLVVAVQPKLLDLAPVPREHPSGATVDISGKLLGVYRNPRVYVTDPTGAPREYRIALRGAEFLARVPCDRGDGRYQLEVFGDGETGPEVLANFPVYCGVAPPTTLDGAAGFVPARIAAADAEPRLLELVNRARAGAGLSPVQADPALAAVARAHSEDMRAHAFVGHVSARTGGPAERVAAAGLSLRRVLENVGRAGSVEEVHAGLMRSPGHRMAILDPRVTHIGIGVVVEAPASGEFSLVTTQLFR